ncbi:lysosomal protective protein-like [Xenia sp. Carnegie-2017]|uniref:lysosomal protective protein-like n=1 Tax=Xenia sp. Carnegie-2017 TaxID=2897299 RepID=UPI001F03D1AC|nr:lysosomal protective protein-like [Xenia sp. Carnegie-2017]
MTSFVFFSLIFFQYIGISWLVVSVEANKDVISSLPGLPYIPVFQQYSGYLSASGGRKFHYWFVESQGNPQTDPVVLWLNGGPGCSSMVGLLSEHGPFLVNPDGKTLRYNPHSWNKVANMLYLESPAGVGFSYLDSEDYATNDTAVAADNYAALEDFFNKYPHFADNPFYITGEGYAGVYVATLSSHILGAVNKTINLKGFAIGNGFLSVKDNAESLFYYAYYHGLLGNDDWKNLQTYCCPRGACTFYESKSASCQQMVELVKSTIMNIGLNTFAIYQNCSITQSNGIDHFFAMENAVYKEQRLLQRTFDMPTSCIDSTDLRVYLNTPAVRQALNIHDGIREWTLCSKSVNDLYRSYYSDMTALIKKILQKTRGLIYNGDTDLTMNFWVLKISSKDLV